MRSVEGVEFSHGLIGSLDNLDMDVLDMSAVTLSNVAVTG